MAELSKTFCPLPFIHSHASVGGHWKPCCNSDHWDTKDNYFTTKTNHGDWFNSERMKELRSDMLSGKQNKMCNSCWVAESESGTSIRKSYIDKFKDIVEVSKPSIKYLDLKLSNECNLACRMCDYTNSSKIVSDVMKIEENDELILPSNWERSPKHERFVNSKGIKVAPDHIVKEIEGLLPGIRVLKLTGGEPTVSPEVLRLFDICIEKGYAKNIELNVTTNATKFTKKFLERIESFKKIKLNISCDGYGDVYEYIRHPFKWEKFNERIKDIENTDISYSITAVPQMYNIENLHKLQSWSKGNRAGKGDYVYLNTYLQPEGNYNSLKFVPHHILEYALERIEENVNSIILVNRLKKLIEEKYQPTDDEYITIMKSVGSIDKVRDQDFRNYLEPMTKEWLEGVFKIYA